MELVRSGRAIPVPDERVNQTERKLRGSKVCKSDDPHVIALLWKAARESRIPMTLACTKILRIPRW